MPSRKKPKSLQSSSLESIGETIFLTTVAQATKDILRKYLLEHFFVGVKYKQEIYLSFKNLLFMLGLKKADTSYFIRTLIRRNEV